MRGLESTRHLMEKNINMKMLLTFVISSLSHSAEPKDEYKILAYVMAISLIWISPHVSFSTSLRLIERVIIMLP